MSPSTILSFQLKVFAISITFSFLSSLSSSEARFASASAYLLLMSESAVATTIITAMGKEGISMSSLGDFWLTVRKRMASSIRLSALSKIDLYSGLASSSIFMSNFFTYSAALGVKGYLAQSLFVSTCFPSGLLLLLHFYAGS